jgi:transcriptional regulator with XRE-family HTH domain
MLCICARFRGTVVSIHALPSLAELVRRFRITAGQSQEKLAERSGLSSRQISDLERAQRKLPRLETIRMLAEGLGLSEQD